MSEKFAGTCQTASPMILTDQSLLLDSGAIDHVVADSEDELQKIEYKRWQQVDGGKCLEFIHHPCW